MKDIANKRKVRVLNGIKERLYLNEVLVHQKIKAFFFFYQSACFLACQSSSSSSSSGRTKQIQRVKNS
jgi:hypothetical protein